MKCLLAIILILMGPLQAMGNPAQSPKACHKNPRCEKTQSPSLKIFVSASMPKEALKSLNREAKCIKAVLIFRGLINDSFKDTQTYFRELEITAQVDPPAFEDHQITAVPTFILGKDQLQGNISLFEALSQFSEKGEMRHEAFILKKQLQGTQP